MPAVALSRFRPRVLSFVFAGITAPNPAPRDHVDEPVAIEIIGRIVAMIPRDFLTFHIDEVRSGIRFDQIISFTTSAALPAFLSQLLEQSPLTV